MEKRKKTTLILGFLIFILGFLIISFTQIPQGLVGHVVFNSQPDATEGKDTYIREDFPNNNFPTATTLSIGKTAANKEFRAILQFNLSSIPQTDTITDAIIQVYLETTAGSSNITIKAYQLTSEWIESKTSWNNKTSSSLWSSAGGDYDSTEIDTQIFLNSSGNYYNFTITELARDWIDGTSNNYGIILIASNTSAGNYSKISSSDSTTSSQRPQIIIEHVANAAPTIDNIATDTTPTNPKGVGEDVTFTIDWTDLESDDTQAYVCNSSTITFSEGCTDKTFCSTTLAQTNPITCSYTIISADNTTTSFWVAVCDANNCSSISSENYFHANHPPIINIIQPNGEETVNQSQGNYPIIFNVSDPNSNALTANIYYGESQNSTTNIIASNINLTNYCTDSDSDTATTNNCTYSWNSTGVYGTYYLTIILNDSRSVTTDSSDSSFDVKSIIDYEAPQITNLQIDSNITSGEQVIISATISDANMDTAWVSFNYTSINITMSNTSTTSFNTSFIAPMVGTYKFKVYAQDKLEQINNSIAWQEFNVTKPNTTTQNETAPAITLPYHTIKIAGQLTAIDPLKNVYAYLNTPDGFTFPSTYPQNMPMENFTADQTKTTIWFLSVPLSEETYSLNITYTDNYANSWNSSNIELQVSSDIGGGYSVEVSGYPEVEATGTYYAEAFFKQSGIYTSPDSIAITIYDSAGNIIPTNPMTEKQTGIYNYSYSVGSAPMAGEWETIINATISSISYYTHEFWKVVGALFDVGDIEILSNVVNNLNISVTADNVGNNPTDLSLAWSLTRTDTEEILDAGMDTFAVGIAPITKYIQPSTDYVGQVQITFVGYYLDTERAGAYKIFSTTAGNIFCGDGICNGDETCSTCPSDCGICPSRGDGGGNGGAISEDIEDIITTEPKLIIYDSEKTIAVISNLMKSIILKIKNTGEEEITDITLTLQNLEDTHYLINPQIISTLKPGEIKEFEINLIIKDFIGEKESAYIIKTGNITITEPFKINVMNFKNYYQKEIENIQKRILDIKIKTQERGILIKLKECENMVSTLNADIEEGIFINAENNLKQANKCVDDVESDLENIIFTVETKKYLFWITICILIIILIAVLIMVIYILRKKFDILTILKQKQELPTEAKAIPKERLIDERIKKIKEKLKS